MNPFILPSMGLIVPQHFSWKYCLAIKWLIKVDMLLNKETKIFLFMASIIPILYYFYLSVWSIDGTLTVQSKDLREMVRKTYTTRPKC